MDGRETNEMEQIQRGLEEFLEKELEAGNAGNHIPAAGRKRMPDRERQGYYDTEYPEDGYRAERYKAGGCGAEGESAKEYAAGRYGTDEHAAGENGAERYEAGEYGTEGHAAVENGAERYEAGRYDTGEYGAGKYDSDEYDKEGEEEEPEVEVIDWDAAGRRDSVRRSSGRQTGGREASEERRNRSQGDSRRGTGSRNQEQEGSRRGTGSRTQSQGGGRRGTGSRTQEQEGSRRGTGSRTQEQEGSRRGTNRPVRDQENGGKSGKKSGRKKGSRLKARLFKFLAVAAVIVALLGFGLYQLVGLAYRKMNYREIASLANEPMKEDGVVNILLIGNDSRDNGEDGRSDAMILLSISSKTKTIYMTSLLRDIYVDIPGREGNRLNAAYSFGGAELLMETIEKNFDISVNRYVLVNFEAFAGLVDAVGGIELELTAEEIEYVNGYLVEYNMLTNRPQGTDNMDTSVSGLVHLNGPQALAYSRNRYLGTDFGRTERQRKVLTAVIGRLPKALLTNAGGLIDGLMPNLTTNLTQYECLRLCLMAGKLLSYDIVSDNIPRPGTYNDASVRGMAVLEVDFEANIRYLKEKIYGE